MCISSVGNLSVIRKVYSICAANQNERPFSFSSIDDDRDMHTRYVAHNMPTNWIIFIAHVMRVVYNVYARWSTNKFRPHTSCENSGDWDVWVYFCAFLNCPEADETRPFIFRFMHWDIRLKFAGEVIISSPYVCAYGDSIIELMCGTKMRILYI